MNFEITRGFSSGFRLKRAFFCSFVFLGITLAPFTARADVLEDMIRIALREHPSMLVGRAQGQAAQADVESARWQFFPTVSVGVEAVSAPGNDVYYSGDERVTTLRVQQPLWAGGKLMAGLQKAKANTTATQAAFDEVRQQLALQVVQSYGEWLGAHLKLQAYEKNLAEHTRLRDQISRRIAQGLGSEVDLALASGRLDAVAAELSSVRVQKSMALTRLSQLLGQPADDALLTAYPVLPRQLPQSEDPSGLERDALAVNPAVLKARAQAQVQEAVVDERRAEVFPEVYLRFERQYGNFSNAAAPDANRLFVGLSSRFGAGLSSLSNTQSARATLQAALSQVDVQARVVSTQIQTDMALANQMQTRIKALKASQVSTVQVFDSYMRQYLVGRKSWLEVMNASRELAQGEVQIADAQANLVVVTWRLAILLQGLDVVVVNNTNTP